jgi:hypothetical protein
MQVRRLALVFLAALAFGAFAAWAKGPATDGIHAISQMRGALGNLSTPWLLVAFAAGAQARRVWSAALIGLFATMIALIAFYLITMLYIDLAGHGYLEDLRLELAANRGYFEGGLVTGLVFGALGGWWQRTRSPRASILVGGLMMAEPLVLVVMGAVHSGGVLSSNTGLPLVIRMMTGWGLSPDSGGISIAVYCAEFAGGLGLTLLGVQRSRRDGQRERVPIGR